MTYGFLALVLFAAAPVFAQSHVDARQLEANKKLALAFFEAGPKGPEAMAEYLAPDYIQHNPRFAKYDEEHHLSGRQGFVGAFKGGSARPQAACRTICRHSSTIAATQNCVGHGGGRPRHYCLGAEASRPE